MTICDLGKYDFDLNNIKFEQNDMNDMCNIINTNFILRRVDFLYCNYDEYPFMYCILLVLNILILVSDNIV